MNNRSNGHRSKNGSAPATDFTDFLEDTRQVTHRLGVAVREALLDHKRAGNPVAIWRDGKVVIVPPEEIVFGNETQAPRPRKQSAEE